MSLIVYCLLSFIITIQINAVPSNFVLFNESRIIIDALTKSTKHSSICVKNYQKFDTNFDRQTIRKVTRCQMTLVGHNRLHATMWLIKAAMSLPFPGVVMLFYSRITHPVVLVIYARNDCC